jgi:hypothetical protein
VPSRDMRLRERAIRAWERQGISYSEISLRLERMSASELREEIAASRSSARGVQKPCRVLAASLGVGEVASAVSSSEVACAVVVGLPGAVSPVRLSGPALPLRAFKGVGDSRAPA